MGSGAEPVAYTHLDVYKRQVSCLEKEFSRRVFAPESFLSQATVEKMEGSYIPFWLYDMKADCHYSGTGIENVLLKMPQIKEAAVVGAPCDILGETVKAFIVVNEQITFCLLYTSVKSNPFLGEKPVSTRIFLAFFFYWNNA